MQRVDSDIARVLILQQRFDEVLSAIERIPAGYLRDQASALTYHAPGQRKAADAALSRMIAQRDTQDRDPQIELAIAEVHALRGEQDAALERIARALALAAADHPQQQDWVREEMMLSPFLKTLQADARWNSLLASNERP